MTNDATSITGHGPIGTQRSPLSYLGQGALILDDPANVSSPFFLLVRLFMATSYIAADAAEHFGLPRDRTVIMGAHIDV